MSKQWPMEWNCNYMQRQATNYLIKFDFYNFLRKGKTLITVNIEHLSSFLGRTRIIKVFAQKKIIEILYGNRKWISPLGKRRSTDQCNISPLLTSNL